MLVEVVFPLPVRPEFLITFLISRAKSLNYSRFAGFRFLLWFVCVIPTDDDDDRGTGKQCANADPESVDHPENAPMVSWMGQVTGEIHAVNKRLKRLAITFRTGKVNPLLAAGAFHRFPFSAVLFFWRGKESSYYEGATGQRAEALIMPIFLANLVQWLARPRRLSLPGGNESTGATGGFKAVYVFHRSLFAA